MKGDRWIGMFGIAVLLFPLASLGLLTATGTPVALLAQYQVDVLFPAFGSPEGILVSNALWLFMLGNIALMAYATGMERRPIVAAHRGSHILACRMTTVAAALYIAEAALSIGLVRGLSPIISAADSISPALRGTGQALILVRNHTAVAAGLLLSLAAFGYARSLFRRHRWAAYLAGTAGLLGLAGAFWPYLEGLNTLRNADYLLFLIWSGARGISYFKRQV